MSLLSGVVNRNCQRVTKRELCAIHNSLKKIPHHSYKERTHQHVAFTCLHTNGKGMPAYVKEQKILFVAQGRIDNKAELVTLLGGNNNTYDMIDDEQLMLEVYLKFKDKTPNKLLGDWSFAAYNFKNNRLFLAQDPCGYNSIFYYTVVSSSIPIAEGFYTF